MDTEESRTDRPRVGHTASRSRLVTRRDIELFTEISGDRNPLHYDDEAAARSRFGGIVVQGGVSTAVLNAVVVVQRVAVARDLGEEFDVASRHQP